MIRAQFPILEHDPCKTAKINAKDFIPKMDIPDRCVIAFFREVIEKKLKAGLLEQAGSLCCETVSVPVYKTTFKGRQICLVLGFVGAPGAAGQLEELIAMGCDKFIVCGGAGVLQKNIAVGRLIVPRSAIRDEGTSYHYLPPGREVACSKEAVEHITARLESLGIPHMTGKTWTTDAVYRETDEKIRMRVGEGCLTVEMEAAALFAVAQFRNVLLGQILYGGDDLSGLLWDNRQWQNRRQIRRNLVDLSLDICLSL